MTTATIPTATRRTTVRREIHEGADYSAEEIAFMLAMDQYKRDHHRPFPTCCEVLAVLKSLGYRQTA